MLTFPAFPARTSGLESGSWSLSLAVFLRSHCVNGRWVPLDGTLCLAIIDDQGLPECQGQERIYRTHSPPLSPPILQKGASEAQGADSCPGVLKSMLGSSTRVQDPPHPALTPSPQAKASPGPV